MFAFGVLVCLKRAEKSSPLKLPFLSSASTFIPSRVSPQPVDSNPAHMPITLFHPVLDGSPHSLTNHQPEVDCVGREHAKRLYLLLSVNPTQPFGGVGTGCVNGFPNQGVLSRDVVVRCISHSSLLQKDPLPCIQCM